MHECNIVEKVSESLSEKLFLKFFCWIVLNSSYDKAKSVFYLLFCYHSTSRLFQFRWHFILCRLYNFIINKMEQKSFLRGFQTNCPL